MGIAVNNAIVMIDAINRLRSTGQETLEAIHQGRRERLRPILMTSVTSIFGLIPLALRSAKVVSFWFPWRSP